MNELSQGQELAKQLLMDDRNGVEKVGAEEIYQADLFCENYKQFLDCGKTEREVAAQVTAMLQQNGYRPFVSQTAYQPDTATPARATLWPWSPTVPPCWGWATSARPPPSR